MGFWNIDYIEIWRATSFFRYSTSIVQEWAGGIRHTCERQDRRQRARSEWNEKKIRSIVWEKNNDITNNATAINQCSEMFGGIWEYSKNMRTTNTTYHIFSSLPGFIECDVHHRPVIFRFKYHNWPHIFTCVLSDTLFRSQRIFGLQFVIHPLCLLACI